MSILDVVSSTRARPSVFHMFVVSCLFQALGVEDVKGFPFMSSPSPYCIDKALITLQR